MTAFAKRGTVKWCLACLVFLSIITILWNYASTPKLSAWFPMAGIVRNTLPLKDDFCAKDNSTVGERNTAACTLLFQQKNYTDCIYVVLMYTIILVLSSFCFCLVCLIVCLFVSWKSRHTLTGIVGEVGLIFESETACRYRLFHMAAQQKLVQTEKRKTRWRRSCRDSNPRPFNHESGALTTELSPLPK